MFIWGPTRLKHSCWGCHFLRSNSHAYHWWLFL